MAVNRHRDNCDCALIHSIHYRALRKTDSPTKKGIAMVSLSKKSPEERLNICRKYYIGGFAFLPLLWLINAIWFYKQAFKVEAYPQQAQIRTCKSRSARLSRPQSILCVVSDVIRSAIGTLVWLAIIIAWNVIFQTYRTRMGPVGDYLTFVLPRGYY